MWTPFAHQPSRVQPVQAKQQPLHLLRALPFVVSCRGPPAAASIHHPAATMRVEELPLDAAAVSDLTCFCSCFCSCFFPARAATSGGTGWAVPHHSHQHLIMDDSAQVTDCLLQTLFIINNELSGSLP